MSETRPALEGPSTGVLCCQCARAQAIYTCPRCQSRTCSAACSRAHKGALSCSGERNKVTYVPPNAYGYFAMVNDLVYLTEVGQHVQEWGKDIAKRGLAPKRGFVRGRGRGQARGRGRGGFRPNIGRSREKVEEELTALDASVVWLPDGMEKRTKNSTRWDTKTQCLLLTVECRIRSRTPGVKPVSILSHQIAMTSTLDSLLARVGSSKKWPLPQWASDTISSPDTLLVLPSYPPGRHFTLDKSKTLKELLSGKTWVEWPVIELWEKSNFRGQVLDTSSSATQGRPAKRRKVEPDTSLMTNLLGAYDSDEEQEECGDAEEEGEILEGAPSGVAAFLPSGVTPMIPPVSRDDEDFLTIDTQGPEDKAITLEDAADEAEMDDDGVNEEIVPEEGEAAEDGEHEALSEEGGPADDAEEDPFEEDDAGLSDDDQATLQHLDELVRKRSQAPGSVS